MKIPLPSIYPVTSHTEYVGPSSTFVAIKGAKEDGVQYILHALEKGATTIVVDAQASLSDAIMQAIAVHGAHLQRVANTRQAFAQLSAQVYNHPAKKLKIIGITGTKGKTTSTFIVEHILRNTGYKTALLSTVINKINGENYPTALTTQQPDYLHAFLHACVQAGVEYVVMEVSAQAVTLHRVEGIAFDTVLFTNFSQEHAEFYTSLDDYFNAKSLLCNYVKDTQSLILNGDDVWIAKLKQQHPDARSFSFTSAEVEYKATLTHDTKEGVGFDLIYQGQSYSFFCPSLLGAYNGYNMLGAVSVALSLGINPQAIAQGLAAFSHVPGRMERYQLPNGACCIIDYAHNPSSFEALLPTLKKLSPHLIVIFGCGGDRDPIKRPIMGALAAQFADLVIVTTDNPRSEDPQVIVQQILAGVPSEHRHKVLCEPDREVAIKKAYSLAQEQTIIALLGKGPDEYQLIQGVKIPFSERSIILSL